MKAEAKKILFSHVIGTNKEKLNANHDFLPSVLKAMEEYAQSQLPKEEVSEEELQQDFRDWLGWNDQDPPDQDDPDYYTYSWGMNVWRNAYKAYKKCTRPTVSEREIEGIVRYWTGATSEEGKDAAQEIKELLNR